MSAAKILVVGESWVKHTIHMKGFDQFHSTEYEEGAGEFLTGLERSGFVVRYLRAHEVSSLFPTTAEELKTYDAIVLSDIGANSFLLTDDTFLRSEIGVNRLELIADYVHDGGGLVMIGGYLSFAGIDGKARYASSPLARVLAVDVLNVDDRVEKPEGVTVAVVDAEHDIVRGIEGEWPVMLGYNKVTPKDGAHTVATIGDDVLIVTAEVGKGRSSVFSSDVAPHWGPPAFLSWEHYDTLWANLLRWTANEL